MSIVSMLIMLVFSRIIPVEVNISINIEQLNQIEEVKMSFSAKFTIAVEWFDGRLTWKDLNDDEFLNIPNKEVIDKLWVPVITFENTENKYRGPIDSEARFVVKERGPLTLSSEIEVEDVAYYKGTENSLQYSRDFHLVFNCDFALHDFPFDTQVCAILLKKPDKEQKFLEYNPTKLEYSGPVEMAEFIITDYEMIYNPEWNQPDIAVKLYLKRRVQKHLLSTYLPSLCLLILSQVQ